MQAWAGTHGGPGWGGRGRMGIITPPSPRPFIVPFLHRGPDSWSAPVTGRRGPDLVQFKPSRSQMRKLRPEQ